MVIEDRQKGSAPQPVKRWPFIILGLLLSLLILNSCSRQDEHRAEFFIFGTIMEVAVWGASERQAEAAFSQLQILFQDMHQNLHAWEPGLLVEINQAFSEGRTARASDQIKELIVRSQEIEKLSGGRFNPAIGSLVKLWGFHTSDFPILGPPPGQPAIQAILDRSPSSLDIRIRDHQLETDNPLVQLDFGGIAKGYAIDLACARLRELGIENAIVNAGGDLRTIGQRGKRPWRVGIRNPGGGVVGGVETENNEAVFTSGVYERFRQDEQTRYPHILDPITGWPVEGISSVTVITREGLLADAAATALIVAGKKDWPAVARALGVDMVLMMDESGRAWLTPEMSRRITFVEEVETQVVDVDSDL